jgi:hypothetical protein
MCNLKWKEVLKKKIAREKPGFFDYQRINSRNL